MKKIYTEKGYINMKRVINSPFPFSFVVMGRGTGKTYGALSEVIGKKCFLYMRRLDTQAATAAAANPYTRINADTGSGIICKPMRGAKGLYYFTDDTDTIYGYMTALSVMKNVRSVDFSNVDILIYDEFIPEANDRKLKGEGEAFLQAYETINRNRELEGRPPLKCVCISNSDQINSPIFLSLGILDPIASAYSKGAEYVCDRARGYEVLMPRHSPISDKKAKTVLYKLTKGTDFYSMAIDNNFSDANYSHVGSRSLAEYMPYLVVGEIEIYQHKSKPEYYVSTHKSGAGMPEFGTSDSDMTRVRMIYKSLFVKAHLLYKSVYFETYACKAIFENYFTN